MNGMSTIRNARRRPRATHGVIDHVLDGDRHRRVVPLDDHAERVADEHDVGAGEIDELREARVVRGEARDRLARLLHLAQHARR